jgi:hypothetical protein
MSDPWTPPDLVALAALARGCGACWACDPGFRFMRVCATCGNKRCPHANDHRNDCTGSNEAGQPGSAYPVFTAEESAAKLAAFRAEFLADETGGAS